jgi:hypothetical protein
MLAAILNGHYRGRNVQVQKNRRQAERRKVLWGARLASLAGDRYLHCIATDISCAGARVNIEDQQFLDEGAYFLDLRNRFAYEAKVVWQRSPELGLQFVRGYRFDELPSEPLRQAIAGEY